MLAVVPRGGARLRARAARRRALLRGLCDRSGLRLHGRAGHRLHPLGRVRQHLRTDRAAVLGGLRASALYARGRGHHRLSLHGGAVLLRQAQLFPGLLQALRRDLLHGVQEVLVEVPRHGDGGHTHRARDGHLAPLSPLLRRQGRGYGGQPRRGHPDLHIRRAVAAVAHDHDVAVHLLRAVLQGHDQGRDSHHLQQPPLCHTRGDSVRGAAPFAHRVADPLHHRGHSHVHHRLHFLGAVLDSDG